MYCLKMGNLTIARNVYTYCFLLSDTHCENPSYVGSIVPEVGAYSELSLMRGSPTVVSTPGVTGLIW